MGTISLDLPVIGQQNTTEDPKIRADFVTLQNLLNGNIDSANLSPGLISQMGQVQNLLSNAPVKTIGESGNQTAGRVLTAADFTNMGVTVAGLWNLSNTNDSSGNGRNLTNRGSVAFTNGITGAPTEAAQFPGATTVGLYLPEASFPNVFNPRSGSWGCWMRCARKTTAQWIMSKASVSPGQFCWWLGTSNVNTALVQFSSTGSDGQAAGGTSDICDDRWHHIVATMDNSRLRLYVDSILENSFPVATTMFPGTGPISFGAGYGMDGTNPGAGAYWGRADEAFFSADVLSEEQVRNLYCLSIAHTIGAPPSDVRLSVRRKKRGYALATSDFPSMPSRLHNFTGGSPNDSSSNGVAFTPNPGTGQIQDVAGVDGSFAGAKGLFGAHTGFSSTDSGLPTGLTPRSMGIWFKTNSAAVAGLFGYGTISTADFRLWINTGGILTASSGADTIVGPPISDGVWHHAVVVEDNAAADGVKRRLYFDGRVYGSSLVMNSVTPVGANNFRAGASPNGLSPVTSCFIDCCWVYPGALTSEQVRAIYNVGTSALATSPKDAADHVEAFEATRILATFDRLNSTDSIDLTVVA